jgi:methyl acetate hydrolase
MNNILNRRDWMKALLVASQSTRLFSAPSLGARSLDDTLRDSMTRRKIPAVVAMLSTPDKTIYTGAFGKRDATSGINVKPDSIFVIASMTKAITTTAAMQLVEQGKVKLHVPVSEYLPQLTKLNIVSFDSAGKEILTPATKPLTLHHLLTHTSGFAYDTWNETFMKYTMKHPTPPLNGGPVPVPPLVFEPGAKWQYSTSVDWAGRVVEAVSGLNLEQYFQRNILQPLGMKDTSYILAADKMDRFVSNYRRQPDGSLKEDPRSLPPVPKAFIGGGGLRSTVSDYTLFMQMILNHGKGTSAQILKPETVAMMTTNQIGDISAGKLKTFDPTRSVDVDFHPGNVDGFTYGFLINKTAYVGGRSAGSLAWAGIDNTFYWIDPKRSLCAVVMMQLLPFGDMQAVGLLSDFEKAVYAA